MATVSSSHQRCTARASNSAAHASKRGTNKPLRAECTPFKIPPFYETSLKYSKMIAPCIHFPSPNHRRVPLTYHIFCRFLSPLRPSCVAPRVYRSSQKVTCGRPSAMHPGLGAKEQLKTSTFCHLNVAPVQLASYVRTAATKLSNPHSPFRTQLIQYLLAIHAQWRARITMASHGFTSRGLPCNFIER